MKFGSILSISIFLIFNVVFANRIRAQTTWEKLQAQPKPSFVGLNKDSITVDIFSNDIFFSFGPNVNNQLRETCIYHLKKAGVKVSSEKLNTLKYPNLYISIQFEPIGSGYNIVGYTFSVSVGLRQKVILERNKKITDYAITWLRVKTSYAPATELLINIRNILKEKIDEFVIEYLKAKT